jgi:hypothetical protein
MAKRILIPFGDETYSFRTTAVFQATDKQVRADAAQGIPLAGEALAVAAWTLANHPAGDRLSRDLTAITVITVYGRGKAGRAYAVIKEDGSVEDFSRKYCAMSPTKRASVYAGRRHERLTGAAQRDGE